MSNSKWDPNKPHTWTSERGTVHDVKKLWELSKDLPVEHVDFSKYVGPTATKLRDAALGSDHEARVLAADLSYPLLISPDDSRADGNHRIAKALRQGLTTLPIKRLTKEHLEKSLVKKSTVTRPPAEKLSSVVMHIGGPSGSGKTTLLRDIQNEYPNLVTKDLDDFDDHASEALFPGVRKRNYTPEMVGRLASERQRLMDEFLSAHKDRDVVLAGHHTEGSTELKIPTETKLLLNTGPLKSAWRAYLRSKSGPEDHRRSLLEIPSDYREAADTIRQYRQLGYQEASKNEIKNILKGRAKMSSVKWSGFFDELVKVADKTRYLHDPTDRSDPDGHMTKSQLSHISDMAGSLDKMMSGDDELPGWVTQHISVAQENLEQVLSYIQPRAKTSSVMDKIARCWEGYEPVPGKKAYSDGSCRPIGGKAKKAEVEHHGHTFPGYNQPIKSSNPEKKMMVLAKKGDQVKLIHFGQKGYKHNYSPEAKKDYLSRSAGIRDKSGNLTKNDKFSANYWARRVLWPKGETGHGSNGPVDA